MSFIIATNNIPARAGKVRVQKQLATILKSGASVVNNQEFMHGLDDIKEIFPPSWHTLSVFAPQPMSFDTNVWDMLSYHIDKVYGDSNVGKAGAGPKILSSRFVQKLALRHKETGAQLGVWNVHGAPSIYLPLQKDGDISRDELHELLMEANADSVADTKTPAVVTGDFNCEWDHPNMRPFWDAGMAIANNPNENTHGKHQIDLVLYRGGIPAKKRRGLELVRSSLLPKVLPDDHAGVLAEFEFTR